MNVVKTFLLMALLTALLIGAGRIVGGEDGMKIMFVISLAINFFSYWFSDSIVIASSGAKEVDANSAPQVYNLVEKLAKNADLPMPRVYIIDSDVPNAFATGRNPEHSAVAVTTGIMKTLDYNEMAGVLGHELAHIKHRDILTGSIAAAMATCISMLANFAFLFHSSNDNDDNGGFIGYMLTVILAPIAASLIQMAISRSREWRRVHLTIFFNHRLNSVGARKDRGVCPERGAFTECLDGDRSHVHRQPAQKLEEGAQKFIFNAPCDGRSDRPIERASGARFNIELKRSPRFAFELKNSSVSSMSAKSSFSVVINGVFPILPEEQIALPWHAVIVRTRGPHTPISTQPLSSKRRQLSADNFQTHGKISFLLLLHESSALEDG